MFILTLFLNDKFTRVAFKSKANNTSQISKADLQEDNNMKGWDGAISSTN